eukprot:UN27171
MDLGCKSVRVGSKEKFTSEVHFQYSYHGKDEIILSQERWTRLQKSIHSCSLY